MHKHYICHRDIKPQNLFLIDCNFFILEDTKLKVLDFGVARAYHDNQKDRFKSMNTQLMYTNTGTLSYKAPEMFGNEGYGKNYLIRIVAV